MIYWSGNLWVSKIGQNRKAIILDTSFLRIKTFSNKVFFDIILFYSFFATCATTGNKYSVHCTCRRLCLWRVKRENDTDRRFQPLNFRECRRYSLFCWRFVNNWVFFYNDLWSLLFSSVYRIWICKSRKHKKTRVFWGNSLVQFRKERCDVTQRTKGGIKTIFFRLNMCVLSINVFCRESGSKVQNI